MYIRHQDHALPVDAGPYYRQVLAGFAFRRSAGWKRCMDREKCPSWSHGCCVQDEREESHDFLVNVMMVTWSLVDLQIMIDYLMLHIHIYWLLHLFQHEHPNFFQRNFLFNCWHGIWTALHVSKFHSVPKGKDANLCTWFRYLVLYLGMGNPTKSGPFQIKQVLFRFQVYYTPWKF